jgi:kinetochore protein Spc7/SPC105
MSEGQRDVKKVELETYEENPPLFREYMSATPDIKALMDNQFKNVKTHARLLSKAMWYEWRMKLQEGLKGGLVETREGMREDDARLRKQQELLDCALPDLTARHDALAKEHSNLEQYAQELAGCDAEELAAARDELVDVEKDMEEKKQEIAKLRQELLEAESGIARASTQKQQCLDDIKEAEKIREECRGWSANEINHFKGTDFYSSFCLLGS